MSLLQKEYKLLQADGLMKLTISYTLVIYCKVLRKVSWKFQDESLYNSWQHHLPTLILRAPIPTPCHHVITDVRVDEYITRFVEKDFAVYEIS